MVVSNLKVFFGIILVVNFPSQRFLRLFDMFNVDCSVVRKLKMKLQINTVFKKASRFNHRVNLKSNLDVSVKYLFVHEMKNYSRIPNCFLTNTCFTVDIRPAGFLFMCAALHYVNYIYLRGSRFLRTLLLSSLKYSLGKCC